MANLTGKAARRQFGTRVSAKRGKRRKGKERTFGKLSFSVVSKNLDPPTAPLCRCRVGERADIFHSRDGCYRVSPREGL